MTYPLPTRLQLLLLPPPLSVTCFFFIFGAFACWTKASPVSTHSHHGVYIQKVSPTATHYLHFPYYSVLSPYSFILISNHCQPSLLKLCSLFSLSAYHSLTFQFAKIAKAWRLFTFMSHFRISMTIRPGVYCPITLSRNEPFNLDWGEPIGGKISILGGK